MNPKLPASRAGRVPRHVIDWSHEQALLATEVMKTTVLVSVGREASWGKASDVTNGGDMVFLCFCYVNMFSFSPKTLQEPGFEVLKPAFEMF